jgi:hypothetical protein
MPTKHVDKLIEAYLDGRLSPNKRLQVKAHLRDCPDCARRLFDARRLDTELSSIMQAALGRPTPQPVLRQRVQESLPQSRSPYFNWSVPGKVLNTAGTVAVIVVFAFGAFTVIRSQNPAVGPETTIAATQPDQEKAPTAVPAVPNQQRTPLNHTTSPERPGRTILSDTLTLPTTRQPLFDDSRNVPALLPWAQPADRVYQAQLRVDELASQTATEPRGNPDVPGGTIAFALYNPGSDRQAYEVHFIDPDGTDHTQFSLGGVSEPALHPKEKYNNLTFRAWDGPTSPQTLQSSDSAGLHHQPISYFWEDAQPDWSPTENRIIFASQRESDRRWRLYSAWGDGSREFNLRREGKSPTFAPDGYHFAFEGCDSSGVSCGIWIGDLENSEWGSKQILVDRSATAPDWSPVTNQIAYMANPDGRWNLYLVDSKGKNIRQITTSATNDGLPAWSPDGEWLAYVSDRGQNWGIWLLHVRSGYVQQTIEFDEAALSPPDDLPFNQHGDRFWWDEQISWGP